MSRYRQTRIRKNLELRARVLEGVRRFFNDRDYLEIETPCRISVPIPEAHIDPEPSGDRFLQASPEICMKPLLAAGFEKIYQICKCYRQGERGRWHLPEMTLLEWYCTGSDYVDMMTVCEELVRFVSRFLGRGKTLAYQERRIDLQAPWERLTVADAFARHATLSLDEALSCGRFDEIIAFEIEPHLGLERPLFLYDYPVAMGALARVCGHDPAFAQRFELYIGGMELCNAFTELTDSKTQRIRFETERRVRIKAGKPATPLPEDFLKCLDDMPAAAGNALGLDRLIMLFADTATIDDVVAFVPEEV